MEMKFSINKHYNNNNTFSIPGMFLGAFHHPKVNCNLPVINYQADKNISGVRKCIPYLNR
jgi:hypothetical protein